MRKFEQLRRYEDGEDGADPGAGDQRPGKFERLRRLVLALSGANPEVLALHPSERVKFESLGWSILITSGIAAVSMWFALSSAMGVNWVIAVFPAVLWGLVIMGIDRWLITSMPVDGKRKFAIAVPRLLLAILLGTLISTPLVLRVFQSEINAQISVIKQNRYSDFLQQQQKSDVTGQVTSYARQLNYLNQVIDSHGASAVNAANDPQIVALTSQLNKWTALKTQYYNAYICQLYGGPACPKKGNGPAAHASYQSYVQASNEVSSIQKGIQNRDKELASNSAAAQQARYQQALTARPTVQNEYNTAVARQNALQASFYAQNRAANGILIRLQALSQLSTGDFTVTAARFLLFLLFLVIECLPVTVKLLQRPGVYEESLLLARAAESGDARRYFGQRARIGLDGLPSDGTRPVLRLRAEPARVNMREIFEGTKALPRVLGDPEDERATKVIRHQYWQDPARERQYDEEVFPGRAYRAERHGDPGLGQTRPDISYPEQTRHDVYQPEPRRNGHGTDGGEVPSVHEALSEMDDRVPAGSDGHGGVPLNWDDE